MNSNEYVCTIRVRYSETDQMGTYYNSRPLEWFECGRTEALRSMGLPYTLIESRDIRLPLVEAHVVYQGSAVYDDELRIVTRPLLCGKASLRFEMKITHSSNGRAVVKGYTLHAALNAAGRPTRIPDWLSEKLSTVPLNS